MAVCAWMVGRGWGGQAWGERVWCVYYATKNRRTSRGAWCLEMEFLDLILRWMRGVEGRRLGRPSLVAVMPTTWLHLFYFIVYACLAMNQIIFFVAFGTQHRCMYIRKEVLFCMSTRFPVEFARDT